MTKYKYIGPQRAHCNGYGYDFSNGPVECDTFLDKLASNPEFEEVKAVVKAVKKKKLFKKAK